MVAATNNLFKVLVESDDDGCASDDDPGSVKKRWGDSDSDSACGMFQKWLSRMKAHYTDDLSQTDQNKHFVHCVVECGYETTRCIPAIEQ